MKFDDILEEIGGFGLYQKWVLFLILLPNLMSGFYTLNPVFLLGVPLHRCAIPGYDNDTYDIQSTYHEELINRTIPLSDMDSETYDRCHLYASVDAHGNGTASSHLTANNSPSKVSCNKWVYDKSVFHQTFVSEIDLVCSQKIWVAHAEMLLYFGMLVGSIASGVLADKYGRKVAMYISILLMIGSSIGLSWATYYVIFVILQFILGAATVGSFMPAYIIALEMTSARKRVYPVVVPGLPYILGLVIYAAIAYSFKDWFRIELVTSLPSVVMLSYWWLIPESPRWLLSQGRVEEAEFIIRKAASWNKANLPDKFLDKESLSEETVTDKNANVLHLFNSKTMCVRSILICNNWFIVSLAYFGLALNTENLNGNLYLNFGVSGLVEFPSSLIIFLCVDRMGRRRLYFWTMVIGGVSCISTLFAIEYAKDMIALTIVLAMIGRLGVAAGLGVQYMHSAELFPTVLRNAGMGCASLSARVGTMIAPYIVNLGEDIGGSLGEAFPLVVFGGLSFMSAVLSMLLPETLDKSLPETVEDGKRFGK